MELTLVLGRGLDFVIFADDGGFRREAPIEDPCPIPPLKLYKISDQSKHPAKISARCQDQAEILKKKNPAFGEFTADRAHGRDPRPWRRSTTVAEVRDTLSEKPAGIILIL